MDMSVWYINLTLFNVQNPDKLLLDSYLEFKEKKTILTFWKLLKKTSLIDHPLLLTVLNQKQRNWNLQN